MSNVMIEARDLAKSYGPVHALKGASFEVRKGEVLGFLGPNGAGKTTTMKILTCFIAPTEGTATINGSDVWEDPVGVRRSIGYLPESTPLYTEMLVTEYLEFMGKMRGFSGNELAKRVKKSIEETNLGEKRGAEIRQLSKGYRQRVGLAQALIHEPPVLILDEPMSGLDPNQAADIRDLIKALGEERTVILSTHNLSEVEVACKRVLIVARGSIVANATPEELWTRAGKSAFLATVATPSGGSSEAKAKFSAIATAGTVREHAGESAGEIVIEIAPKENEDLRADIFRCAVDNGFTLLGLEKRAADLESIFRELTTSDAPSAETK